MLGEGKDVAEVCRELQVSEQTYYRWRNPFGGMNADDAKQTTAGDTPRSATRRQLSTLQPPPTHESTLTECGTYVSCFRSSVAVAYCGRPVGR